MTKTFGIVARRPTLPRPCSRHTDAPVVLLTLLAAVAGSPATLAQAPASPPAGAVGIELQVPLRATPFQVGFDASLDMHSRKNGDLRFVVGTRFDFGELLGKLKSF